MVQGSNNWTSNEIDCGIFPSRWSRRDRALKTNYERKILWRSCESYPAKTEGLKTDEPKRALDETGREGQNASERRNLLCQVLQHRVRLRRLCPGCDASTTLASVLPGRAGAHRLIVSNTPAAIPNGRRRGKPPRRFRPRKDDRSAGGCLKKKGRSSAPTLFPRHWRPYHTLPHLTVPRRTKPRRKSASSSRNKSPSIADRESSQEKNAALVQYDHRKTRQIFRRSR